LLDLDVARYQGGWGRIKYVNDQLAQHEPDKTLPKGHGIPSWNDAAQKVRAFANYATLLEERGVYFSFPMDLDFAMLLAYPQAYGVVKAVPDEAEIQAVLGKSHHDSTQYTEEERKLFSTYHQRFKLGSKPAAHIEALANLSDVDVLANMPESLGRLADAVIARLAELPE